MSTVEAKSTSTGLEAFAELSEDGSRIEVHFKYDKRAVLAIKRVPGYKFINPAKAKQLGHDHPFWTLPLDLTSARRLREEFGDGLTLGKALKRWGNQANRQEQSLREIHHADDYKLERLPKVLPQLVKFIEGKHKLSKGKPARSYQKADIAFMARTNAINANQPSLGKTVETIGAVFEGSMEGGPKLIIAPKTSLEVVWLTELDRWQDQLIYVMSGSDSKRDREEIMAEIEENVEDGEPFWLVVNPAMVRYERDKKAAKIIDEKGREVYPLRPANPELFGINWKVVIADEYHKQGLTNMNSQMTRAFKDLSWERLYLLSGTPMGGKPLKLFAGLQLVEPDKFTSKWRWVDQWLDSEEEEVRVGGVVRKVRHVYGIQEGREDEFYKALAPHMVRRTKAEVFKELPPIQHIHLDVNMTATQERQYKKFAADAEIKIENENLSATSILAEYMRLKQFAGAYHKIERTPRHDGDDLLKLRAQPDSGKLEHVLEILEERGISGDSDKQEGDEQVIIGSQFKEIINMVCDFLNEKGIKTDKITGDVGQEDRTRLIGEFQEGDFRVLCMTTTAGGVAITLDKANTAIMLDETWDPDDQEQFLDRTRAGSREGQVTAYFIRSRDTIEHYIWSVTQGKQITNQEILDLRRQGLRALNP